MVNERGAKKHSLKSSLCSDYMMAKNVYINSNEIR